MKITKRSRIFRFNTFSNAFPSVDNNDSQDHKLLVGSTLKGGGRGEGGGCSIHMVMDKSGNLKFSGPESHGN